MGHGTTKAYSEWIRVLQPGGRMINFDENQYLYLFDEDYKKEKERRGEPEYMKKYIIHKSWKSLHTNFL